MANLKAVLSIPAASRGYTNATSGMLKPNRTDNPMMVTGDLMRSLFTRVVPIVATDNATISIFHGFSTISSKKDGSDYGDTLNENHRSIRGFKERAADKLRIAIATTLGVI